MKTAWDYTDLAKAYEKRPEYAPDALDELFALTEASSKSDVCDIGAGVAHLTLAFAPRVRHVTAVEPNDAMRAGGRERTKHLPNVTWVEAVAENTGLPPTSFDVVTFGSSFNVTDRPKALVEVSRILRPRGWFACMWNHRDLDDPIQREIEAIIKARVPAYDYGTRREDQTDVLVASNLFEKVHTLTGTVVHDQTIDECVEAWRSHATLARQAGTAFPDVIEKIHGFLRNGRTSPISIPYTTRIWAARLVR